MTDTEAPNVDGHHPWPASHDFHSRNGENVLVFYDREDVDSSTNSYFLMSFSLYILLNFERDLLADCLLQRKLIVARNVAKTKNTNVQPIGSSEFQSSSNSCITSP